MKIFYKWYLFGGWVSLDSKHFVSKSYVSWLLVTDPWLHMALDYIWAMTCDFRWHVISNEDRHLIPRHLMTGMRLPDMGLQTNARHLIPRQGIPRHGMTNPFPDTWFQDTWLQNCFQTLDSSLESGVRKWFWNSTSWNHVSGICWVITGLGITCLGIRCPELVL